MTTNFDQIKVLWLHTRIVTRRLFNTNNYSQEQLKNTDAVWFTCLRYSACIFFKCLRFIEKPIKMKSNLSFLRSFCKYVMYMFSKCPKRGKTINGSTNDNHELGFECFGVKVISAGKG